MRRKLIIDGNAVYEIDDECECRKEEKNRTTTVLREKGKKDHRNEERSPAVGNTSGGVRRG